jgi:two-component system, NtrC family, response regulator
MNREKPKLLIVDDDEEIRTQMRWALASDYNVALAGDRAQALDVFEQHQPLVVLLDLGLPPRPNDPEEGLAALAAMLAKDSSVKVIIASGQGEKENALRAIGAGAYDFLSKPVDPEELKLILRRCVHVAQLEREFRHLQNQQRADEFAGMLGTSAAMQSVFNGIRKVAGTGATVLLLGESGTGKEVAANAIHSNSRSKDGPFVAINCNALPESLLESELFGHEKGSFTGAHIQRKGLFETAEGGTLFLDEIGDLPAPLQVKLLRTLQERKIQRVGGRQEIPVDTRVVAATNADIQAAIQSGRFREDLYFRLAVVTIQIPPLREREGDAVLVATEFLRRFAAENGREGLSFSPEALKAVAAHPWPGNIRELQNRVRRAVIMTDKKRITPEDLELVPSEDDAPVHRTLKEAREALERRMVTQALQQHRGKVAPAAAALGISRPTFYELMEKLGIQKAAELKAAETAA